MGLKAQLNQLSQERDALAQKVEAMNSEAPAAAEE